MKVQRKIKKRTLVLNNENEDEFLRNSSLSYVKKSDEVVKLIMKREKPFRTIENVLQSPMNDFSKIFKKIQEFSHKEKKKKRPGADQPPTKEKKQRKNSTNKYSRYEWDSNQVMEGSLKGGNDIISNINTKGSITSRKRKANDRGERKSNTRSSHHTPIVIVPSAMSMILISNIKEFLENGNFINEDVEGSIKSKEKSLVIHRIIYNSKARFEIIDSTKARTLQENDWGRVIAVFSQGQDWQFKGWKYTTPSDVFSRAKGFYLHYDSDVIPNSVKSWNVTFLPISKHTRHYDKIASLKFWEEIEPVLLQKQIVKKT